MKNKKQIDSKNLRKLCECAVLVAMAFVLSLFKIPKLFGGSVTFACMVPLVIASFRNGIGWGFAASAVFSVIKLFMGLDNFTYVAGALSVIVTVLFDYILAYTAVGISGIAKPSASDSRLKLSVKAAIGAFVGMFMRFACHVVSGAVVWYDLTKVWEADDPTHIVFKYGKWVYSIVYNGSYMVPETIITVALTAVLVFTLGGRVLAPTLKKKEK